MTARPTLVCVVPNPSIDRTAEVDRLEPGRIHRPTEVVAVPGGKGLNVARAAWNLGQPVQAILLLAGHAGRWIADELDRLGIPHREAWTDGETRTCLSVLDRSTGELTEVYEPGRTVSADAWAAFVGEVATAVAGAGAGGLVALSGSLPPGAPSGGAAAIVSAIDAAGGRALVDTSGPALATAIDARPFVVKVNAAEAGMLLERTIETAEDAVDAAKAIVARGAQRAIVTRSAEGVVGVDDQRTWVVDAPPGAGPQTVGAGDAFLGGLAAGLIGGEPFEECLRSAVAVAVAATRIAGPGNVDIGVIDVLRRNTVLRRLE